MRKLVAIGALVAVAGCTTGPQTAPVVSWSYGTGAGEGVQYSGDKPTYTRTYGAGAGETVTSGQTATTRYSYGGDNQTGGMVQFGPPRQVLAAPAPAAPTPVPQPAQAAPGTHI